LIVNDFQTTQKLRIIAISLNFVSNKLVFRKHL
jgi:hypothetical protein